jgi:hypothetical protein
LAELWRILCSEPLSRSLLFAAERPSVLQIGKRSGFSLMSDLRTIRVFEAGEVFEAFAAYDALVEVEIEAELYNPSTAEGPEPHRMGWTNDFLLMVPEADADRAEAAIAASGLGISVDERVREVVAAPRAALPSKLLVIVGGALVVVGSLLVTPAIPLPDVGLPLLAIGVTLLLAAWLGRRRARSAEPALADRR